MITFGETIKLKLVNEPDLDQVVEAWRHSRPADTQALLEDILKVDVPVTEFATFVIQGYMPIIMREYLTSFRDHTIWARTSRVDDLNHWPILVGSPIEPVKKLYEEMLWKRTVGQVQDDYRFCLPLSYMTHLTFALNLRQLAGLIRLCEEETERSWKNGYVANMFDDFGSQLGRILYSVIPAGMLVESSINSPLGDTDWAYYNQATREYVGSFLSVTATVPIALRAQIVRHRSILFKDDLRRYFTNDNLAAPISSPVQVQLAMDREFARKVAEKRNCWISQDRLWSPILEQINKGLKPWLPCDFARCPYAQDNLLRIDGKDPAPPCPIFLRDREITATIDQAKAMSAEGARRIHKNFWNDRIREVEIRETENA